MTPFFSHKPHMQILLALPSKYIQNTTTTHHLHYYYPVLSHYHFSPAFCFYCQTQQPEWSYKRGSSIISFSVPHPSMVSKMPPLFFMFNSNLSPLLTLLQWDILLLLEHTKHNPTSEPLRVVVPSAPSPRYLPMSLFCILQVFAQCHLREALPILSSYSTIPHTPYSPFLLLYIVCSTFFPLSNMCPWYISLH